MSSNINDKLNKMGASFTNKNAPVTTQGTPNALATQGGDQSMDPNSMNQIMRKAQEIQIKMQDIQRQIAEMIIVGESGGGAVKITMSGLHYAKNVFIDPKLLAQGMEKAILEDLVASAINNAADKIEKGTREKMAALADTMDLPEAEKAGA